MSATLSIFVNHHCDEVARWTSAGSGAIRSLRNMSSAVALCVTIAALITPTASFAGFMSVPYASSVSLSTPTDQVDWRAYPHRHCAGQRGAYAVPNVPKRRDYHKYDFSRDW